MALDGNGNIYVEGYSFAAWGSPARDYTSGQDAFMAKVDTQGELIWNTFLGGSGTDLGIGIALDGVGNAYLSGESNAAWGSPVRAYASAYDAFVAKLSPNGDLTWNTFLGGSGNDAASSIAVNNNGSIYTAGNSTATWGSPARPYTSDYDAFVAGLDPSGTLAWNTFLGGVGEDHGLAMTMDGRMNVYVMGDSTASWGSPVRAYAGSQDAFVAQLSPFHLNLPLVIK